MRLGINRIDNLLVSRMFEPSGGITPGREQTALVMSTEFGARLHRPDGGVSNGGRLMQHIADRMGVTVMGFVRPGIDGKRSTKDIIDLYRALDVNNGNYDQTVVDVGTVLNRRLTRYNSRLGQRVLTARSGAATFLAGMLRYNRMNAGCGVLLEPAGLYDFDSARQGYGAHRAYAKHQLEAEEYFPRPPKPDNERDYAEPVSKRLQALDVLLYTRLASSDHARDQLMRTTRPTAVEIGEFGLYHRVTPPGLLAYRIGANNRGIVRATVRPKVTHAWYDASDNHARAINAGLKALEDKSGVPHFPDLPV